MASEIFSKSQQDVRVRKATCSPPLCFFIIRRIHFLRAFARRDIVFAPTYLWALAAGHPTSCGKRGRLVFTESTEFRSASADYRRTVPCLLSSRVVSLSNRVVHGISHAHAFRLPLSCLSRRRPVPALLCCRPSSRDAHGRRRRKEAARFGLAFVLQAGIRKPLSLFL